MQGIFFNSICFLLTATMTKTTKTATATLTPMIIVELPEDWVATTALTLLTRLTEQVPELAAHVLFPVQRPQEILVHPSKIVPSFRCFFKKYQKKKSETNIFRVNLGFTTFKKLLS